jgi:hypothetical protein
LKRAQGALEHPIFLGMLLVLMAPWAGLASREWKSRGGRAWWRWLPAILGGAVLVTVSRGAHLAYLATLGIGYFFARPGRRVALLAAAVVLAGVGYGLRAGLAEAMGRAAGEGSSETRLIMIDGDEVEYTGTNHRILLFRVYENAIARCGWFGYGSELRGVEVEESLQQRFGSIDNHYLLFFLQHGWASLIWFGLLIVVSLAELGRVAWWGRDGFAEWAGLAFGALAATSLNLMSVWFSPDFGACWLFVCGLACSVRGLGSSVEIPVEQEPSEACVRLRLVPGCAPRRGVGVEFAVEGVAR